MNELEAVMQELKVFPDDKYINVCFQVSMGTKA